MRTLYFDDETWKIRHLVVKAGGFFSNRRVLVAPEFVQEIDRHGWFMRLGLTKRQAKDAPGIETERPVADQQEAAYFGYRGAYPY